ncbi:hypothetical protein B0T24DRAFT_208411 [Lasiosphaeria ovina]|uniref:N-acetyltransferase domain-containing protein n=1 Tax=Lasiosphaeria ovina TaxID=92902 RepID=A0AAE0KGP0_9PEZI|nr:hypothetical protein B0T24DRAFT_208411 [Lasiosphaeria ovina]
MAFVRPFKPEDTEDCKFICRDTLPPSLQSSEGGIRAAPYLWLLQFTHLFPGNCFVLDDGAGKTVGYVIGVPDVYAFAEAYPRYVAEVLGSEQGRADVPVPRQLATREPSTVADPATGNPAPNVAALAQEAYNFDWLVWGNADKRALNAAYRSVLHINLLAPFRGQGWGRKMIDAFAQSVRRSAADVKDDEGNPRYSYGRGIHLGISGENTKVVPFYERVGFRVYPGGEKINNVWMVMDL